MRFIKPKFLVRINYKSGHSEEFWVWKFEFKINGDNKEFKWVSAGGNKPTYMNVSEVESVWCAKTRYWLFLGDESSL
jgi:predicted component of type VI protein secretion system